MQPDPTNTIFQKAVSFVNQTNKHLFITGKAGTGKTTFLKYIKENSYKKMAVVAPTGVAAINAGGVTLHSFFQLPLGMFVPSFQHRWGAYDGEMNNPATLIKNLRLPTAKRIVIRELDLLVIDEVSMVRADLLDAVDTVMRHIRRQPLIPFGGVQVVYIGDLYQLPPVVKQAEWEVMKDYYPSPFFFHAAVIKHAFPLFIELKKIYRQKDDRFINLLNNIRNNCCTEADLEYLHRYYKPGYRPTESEQFITLTSHNGKADTINLSELEKLPEKLYSYAATVTGEFNDRAYPADKVLGLKQGAQVMFIKNDKGEARRWYNGKIATISRLEKEKLYVTFNDDPAELEVEKETWKNIRYQYLAENDQLDEEELGSFSQYPLRLAWAITIHKSQGLTFQKAIIDAGASFAPGQVYVSLSRLTSIEGLVLYSRILPHTISTDQRVIDFVKNEQREDELGAILQAEQLNFARKTLSNGFNIDKMVSTINDHFDAYEQRQIPNKNVSTKWCQTLLDHAKTLQEVSQKFMKQLDCLFIESEKDHYVQLHQRVKVAIVYFAKCMEEQLVQPTKIHLKNVTLLPKTKKYVKDLQQLHLSFQYKNLQLQQSLLLAEALAADTNMDDVLQLAKPTVMTVKPEAAEIPKPAKIEKGQTQRISLQLFKNGQDIDDIARERNLSPGTIEGHLAGFVATGELDVLDLISNEKLDEVIAVVTTMTKEKPTDPVLFNNVKQRLSNSFSYGQIKAALQYMEKEKLTLKIDF